MAAGISCGLLGVGLNPGYSASVSPSRLVLTRSEAPSGYVLRSAHTLSASKIASLLHVSRTDVKNGKATGYIETFSKSKLGVCCIVDAAFEWKTTKAAQHAFHSLVQYDRKHHPDSPNFTSSNGRAFLQSISCMCAPGARVTDTGQSYKSRYVLALAYEAKYKGSSATVTKKATADSKTMQQSVIRDMTKLLARTPSK